MDIADQRPLAVHVAAIEGTTRPGSSLFVQLVDVSLSDAVSTQLASATVDDWSGEACVLTMQAPSLSNRRDYAVIAHTSDVDDMGAGDWITSDHFPVVDRVARITLNQI